MINPFKYGSVVMGGSFCNRTEELARLKRCIENSEIMFVYAERRVGKTSLIRRVLNSLPSSKYLTAYIDLWPTNDAHSFVSTTARVISECGAKTADKVLQQAKQLFSSLAPSITLDDSGAPRVTFGISEAISPKLQLNEVLDSPERLAASTGKKVCVVFDEFQQILEYQDDSVERTLRSIVQNHTNVSYIFCGSRQHIIQKMFLDRSRPLYRAGGHFPLGTIDKKHWIPFITDKFVQTGKTIETATIEKICLATEGHPFYTQHLCHALWELSEDRRSSGDTRLQQAMDLLLAHESYAYETLWESLALSQRKFLSGLANEPHKVKPFSGDFIAKYSLGSASAAQRASEGLLMKDIIDRENGSFVISDRFFQLWIRQMTQQ